MRILLVDPFHGAAGDMIVGALLALGADQAMVVEAMESVVGTPGIEWVDRGGIRALRVDVHAPVTPRTLAGVLERVDEASSPKAAKDLAQQVFLRMHEAEKSVHGGNHHFHEVGADDAVADVVGAATALHSLGVDGVAVLPVTLARGYADGAHGTFPLPSPATVALLKNSGIQTVIGGEGMELCTPTGAALLAEFSTMDPSDLGAAAICGVGYGAGARDLPGTPNVLRAMLMETDEPMVSDRVDILETNVDDVSGEVIAYTVSCLTAGGARDVSVLPAQMKKGRSGHLIRVICTPADSNRFVALMARELGTLGVRVLPSVHRLVAERTVETVTVRIGEKEYEIGIKCMWAGNALTSLKAEYEDIRAAAADLAMPLRDVKRIAEAAAWENLAGARLKR